MRWSEIFLKTLKEKPVDASIPSHILLLRAGYITKSSQGIYVYNSLFLKVLKKLEKIVRANLEKEGAREILMPMVQSKKIWEKSGRWEKFEGLLLKMKNRQGQEICLGPTHEELISEFVKVHLKSFKDMPVNLYQIQTKYRDEIRPRFGLMRAREFLMKDAYSFDRTEKEAKKSYEKMYQAYKRIFESLGVRFVVAGADSGSIGGSLSEEFHILAENGEDGVMVAGSKAFNKEICPRISLEKDFEGKKEDLEEFKTNDIKTIKALSQFLKVKEEDLVKILFFIIDEKKEVAVLCLGNDDVSPVKLKTHLGLKEMPFLAGEKKVGEISGASPGSCGPWNLKKKIPIYLDQKLKSKGNFITGANKEGFHVRGVNPGRDFKVAEYGDFCFAKKGDFISKDQVLQEERGIEVGHLFYLGQIYSQKMDLTYLDEKGKKKYPEMGCYGLGMTRVLQAVVEQSHDENGIIWPKALCPSLLHICLIDVEEKEVLNCLKELEGFLEEEGIDFFIDDRKERPGVKFKDADLLGLPLRINLGIRDLEKKEVEMCVRKTGEKTKVKRKNLKKEILKKLDQM